MTFEDRIKALMNAQDALKSAATERAPIGVQESLTEMVAQARGDALFFVCRGGDPDEIPVLPSLQEAVIEGMKQVLEGEEDRGQELVRMAHVIRDVAYPSRSLRTQMSVGLFAKIKSGQKTRGS